MYLQIFCSHLVFINWLQNHLLKCPFKTLTGIDCPGCGFQRSLLQLVQGHWRSSFALYPATIPILLFLLYGLADNFFNLDNSKGTLKKSLFMLTGSIVLVSYCVKLWSIYHHYNISA